MTDGKKHGILVGEEFMDFGSGAFQNINKKKNRGAIWGLKNTNRGGNWLSLRVRVGKRKAGFIEIFSFFFGGKIMFIYKKLPNHKNNIFSTKKKGGGLG